MMGFINPTMIGASIKIAIEYIGDLPKNSPKKISFALTGVASNVSLDATSFSLYILFKGYIISTKNNIIMRDSMVIATTGLNTSEN
ncbi:hypothetical protein ES703_97609 [subsurface metagenome]